MEQSQRRDAVWGGSVPLVLKRTVLPLSLALGLSGYTALRLGAFDAFGRTAQRFTEAYAAASRAEDGDAVPSWLAGRWGAPRGGPDQPTEVLELRAGWEYLRYVRFDPNATSWGHFHLDTAGGKLLLNPKLFAVSAEQSGGRAIRSIRVDLARRRLIHSDGRVFEPLARSEPDQARL